jgi:hypothetical protein
MDDTVDEKRVHARFTMQLEAKTLLTGWTECSIFDVSPKGIGIKLQTIDAINVGSAIYMEIFVPKELGPIALKGILVRIKKEENHFVGGIELFKELTNSTLLKLRDEYYF